MGHPTHVTFLRALLLFCREHGVTSIRSRHDAPIVNFGDEDVPDLSHIDLNWDEARGIVTADVLLSGPDWAEREVGERLHSLLVLVERAPEGNRAETEGVQLAELTEDQVALIESAEHQRALDEHARLKRAVEALVEGATLIERMRHEHAVNQRWPCFSLETRLAVERVQVLLRDVIGDHEHVRGDGYEMCRVCGQHVPETVFADASAVVMVDNDRPEAPLQGWGTDVRRWRSYVDGNEPCPCVQCGREVERARRVYVHPTCYACLPPPPPLEVLRLPQDAGEDD
jgi:hypothetical protein